MFRRLRYPALLCLLYIGSPNAINVRPVLHYNYSTVSTITPVPHPLLPRQPHTISHIPSDAPCLPFPSLLFLLLPISQSTRNIIHDPTHRTSYMIHEPFSSADNDGQGTGHGRRGRKDEQEEGRSLMDHARVVFTGVSGSSWYDGHGCSSLPKFISSSHLFIDHANSEHDEPLVHYHPLHSTPRSRNDNLLLHLFTPR